MLIWMYNTLFFRDKIEQLVCNLWDINSELFSPTAVKLQGRATFLTLSNPSCHHTYYESMFLSSTLWRLALWCWGWDSAHHLFSPPAGFCWVPPTGDARGDWKAGGGKGDVVLLSFFFFIPPMSPQQCPFILSMAICSSPQLCHWLTQNLPHHPTSEVLGSSEQSPLPWGLSTSSVGCFFQHQRL